MELKGQLKLALSITIVPIRHKRRGWQDANFARPYQRHLLTRFTWRCMKKTFFTDKFQPSTCSRDIAYAPNRRGKTVGANKKWTRLDDVRANSSLWERTYGIHNQIFCLLNDFWRNPGWYYQLTFLSLYRSGRHHQLTLLTSVWSTLPPLGVRTRDATLVFNVPNCWNNWICVYWWM